MASQEKTLDSLPVKSLDQLSAVLTAPPAGAVNRRQAPGRAASASLVRSPGLSTPAVLALGALLIATTIARFVYRANGPLWLDEVWTGMIASQRSLSSFVRQCYLDVNAPLGYLIAWLWEPIGGLSNHGLRLPSAIFASLAPLVALVPSHSVPMRTRAIWAGLITCWLPGFIFASEARCYSLALCLGVANTLAFAALLRSPRVKPAFVWAAISSLLILTHYVATTLVACEGLAYLILWRKKGLRAWPALAAFFPAAVEMAAHATVLTHFSAPAPTSHASARLQDLPDAIEFAIGSPTALWVLVLCAAAGMLAAKMKGRLLPFVALNLGRRSEWRLWIVPATALGSVLVCVFVSLVCVAASWARPLLVVRYFTPAAPGVLLGLALLVNRIGESWRPTAALVIGSQAALAFAILAGGPPGGQPISFQPAAEALMRSHVSRVEFLWDDRDDSGGDHEAFSKVGGFFFHRAGRPIETDAVFRKLGGDPNLQLLGRANANGAAILWLYNTNVGTTAALRFPPRIAQIDPRWRCHDFGADPAHVLACTKETMN
jgi:hypothetical protein